MWPRHSGNSIRSIALIVGAALALSLSGCATSAYLQDRRRDLADVFTVSVGYGLGAKGRVGPFQAASPPMVVLDIAGLRCGQWFFVESKDQRNYAVSPCLGIPVDGGWGFFGFDYSPGGRLATEREKAYVSTQLLILCLPFYFDKNPEGKIVLEKAENSSGPYTCHSYFTQIEVVVALVGSLRIGLNPGEFVDFLLGWGTVDLYGDDIGLLGRGRETTSNAKGAEQPCPGR